MDRQLRQFRQSIGTSLKNYISSLQLELNDARRNENLLTGKIASAPDQEKQGISIQRQQALKEALYTYLLNKREEVALQQAINEANVRLVEGPLGNKKVSPRGSIIMLVSLLIGLAIPVSILYLRETTRTTIRGKKDLENVIVPYLGEIPLVYKSINKWYGTQREVVKNQIVVKAGTRNIINEAFRVLRTNMEFMTTPDTNVMAITSFNPGSGKSFYRRKKYSLCSNSFIPWSLYINL